MMTIRMMMMMMILQKTSVVSDWRNMYRGEVPNGFEV
jgi:hypothetical protein